MDAVTPATRALARRLCTHAASQGAPAAVHARMHDRLAVAFGPAQCATLSARARHQARAAHPAPEADAGADGDAAADCAAFIGLLCLFLGEALILRLLAEG